MTGPATAGAPKSPPAPLTIDFGYRTAFTFRGRAYFGEFPMVASARLTGISIQAVALGIGLTPENASKYHAVIRQVPALLWANTRPVGRVRRLLRLLGLLRNPFNDVSETELAALVQLFRTFGSRSSLDFRRTDQKGAL